MGKVSSAKKQRDKKKLDKLQKRKEKEDKMRRVLASLEVIASDGPKKEQKEAQTTPSKSTDPKATGTDSASAPTASVVIDKEAIYKEMRSSKTMKRKWRETSLSKKPKKPESEAPEADLSSDEEDDKINHEMLYDR